MEKTKAKWKPWQKWTFGIITVFIILIIIGVASGDKSATTDESASAAETASNSSESATAIGQVLKTRYFDVTVNSAKTSPSVNTGNEFADLKAEQGNKYLIIDITLKNTDEESRMMFDGEVKINYNNKEYKYEQAEAIMLDGWGMIMENINALVTKRTKLVYKIPEEITGPAYYYPARSGSDDKISLGNIQ